MSMRDTMKEMAEDGQRFIPVALELGLVLVVATFIMLARAGPAAMFSTSGHGNKTNILLRQLG